MKKNILKTVKRGLDRIAREGLPEASSRLAQVRQGASDLRERLEGAVRDALTQAESPATEQSASELATQAKSDLSETRPEPPVVARLMIEIRSDGTRTIARGAVQDELTGERVAIEAFGNTPLELAGQLAKSLLTTPFAQMGRAASLLSRKKP